MKLTTTNRPSLAFAAATLSLCALAFSAVGCGGDSNGSGTGGMSGGGSGGTSGGLGPIKGTTLEAFDVSAGTITINDWSDPMNLGGVGSATAAMTTATFDSTEGSPTPGALKVTAPFSGWNQYVDFRSATLQPPQNWSGKKFHVRLKVASGFVDDMNVQGGAQPYVKTGTSYTFGSMWTNVARGSAWQEMVVDLSSITTAGFDPTMVVEFGMQIATGQGNATAAVPTPGTFYVDSFSIE